MRHRLQDAVARWLVRRDWVVHRSVRGPGGVPLARVRIWGHRSDRHAWACGWPCPTQPGRYRAYADAAIAVVTTPAGGAE